MPCGSGLGKGRTSRATRLVVALLLVPSLAWGQNWPGTAYDAVVTRVVDGDTIQVRIGEDVVPWRSPAGVGAS